MSRIDEADGYRARPSKPNSRGQGLESITWGPSRSTGVARLGAELFPRRQFLASLAAALIAPLAVPQRVAAQTTPPSAKPAIDASSLAARTDVNDRMTVEVRINNMGPFQFVVDTGADRSVFSDSIAERLALPGGEPVQVEGLSSTILAPTALVNRLTFGPFTRRDLQIPLLPNAYLGCDGYLGLDVISDACVTFDFARRKLRIEYGAYDNPVNNRVYNRDTASTQVRLSGGHGRLRATNCRVDGVRTQAFIDSGAEVSIGNLALLEALNRRKNRPQELGQTVLVGVTGGHATGRLVSVGSIEMQGLKFYDGAIAIADVQNFAAWGLEAVPAVLIGIDYLRQFGSVSIDYRARRAQFELGQVGDQAGLRRIA